MASSLEKLAAYLNDADETITHGHCNSIEEFQFLAIKKVFPYEYVDGWNKLNE